MSAGIEMAAKVSQSEQEELPIDHTENGTIERDGLKIDDNESEKEINEDKEEIADDLEELRIDGLEEYYHRNGGLHRLSCQAVSEPDIKPSKLFTCCVKLYKIIGIIHILLGIVILTFAFVKALVVYTPSAVEFTSAFFVIVSGILVVMSRAKGDKCLAFAAFMVSIFGTMMLACGVIFNAKIVEYARLDFAGELDTVPEFGYYSHSASTDAGLSAVAISFICCVAGCCLSIIQVLVTVHVLQTPFHVQV